MVRDLLTVPDDLPVPIDDGACDYLPGMTLPPIALFATAGEPVVLANLTGRTVVYVYPRTGEPDKPLGPDWNLIPGARGCTPQSCGFRDHHAEIQGLGAQVFGLSTQDTGYQREAVDRLHLPFPILSDSGLIFTTALRLPTFDYQGMTLIKRLTLFVRDGKIEGVLYPVFPPGENAERAIEWLQNHPIVGLVP